MSPNDTNDANGDAPIEKMRGNPNFFKLFLAKADHICVIFGIAFHSYQIPGIIMASVAANSLLMLLRIAQSYRDQ